MLHRTHVGVERREGERADKYSTSRRWSVGSERVQFTLKQQAAAAAISSVAQNGKCWRFFGI